MHSHSLQNLLADSVDYIRSKTQLKPRVGLTLGSGLGAFVDRVKVEAVIPYDEIPGFVSQTADGQVGRLVLGYVGDVPIALLQGRVHYYEGHSMAQVVYPSRTVAMLGVEVMILTNSAGGLDPDMRPGDFLVMEDHINLMGANPLMGPNLKQLGPRFPDMSEAYDRALNKKLISVMKSKGLKPWTGIYCAVSGPTYETPAEVRYLQLLGGKAVGMSTVPETIAANHLGLRVVGISCISNLAAGLSQSRLSQEEVRQTAHAMETQFCDFLSDFIPNVFGPSL